MAANPFRFAASGDVPLLPWRTRERDELLGAFAEGRNLCLVAPRGAGKTALLHDARDAATARGLDVVYVDLFPAVDARRFAEIYASALTLGPRTTVEAMQQAVQQLVPTLTPRITLSGSGKPSLQLDLWDRERDLRALLERLFAAPAERAARTQKQVVVIFDDFEDLLAVADEGLLQPLAQAIRRQTGVSSCFVLRRESSAESTFTKPKSPFYRLAEPVLLEDLPVEEIVAALSAAFANSGVDADPQALAELAELAQCGPHQVRLLAHALYDLGRESGRAGEAELSSALEHVLSAGAYEHRWQWEQYSPLQRNLVLAIARGHTERLHSQRMVFQLGLGSPSTVAKNLKVLVDREVLRKRDNQMRFVDPFFGLWLARRMS